MPVVALAGGTSISLGRSITTALLNAENGWTPVILSRSTTRPLWLRAVDPTDAIPVVAIDYKSAGSIASALREHGVHTLISVTLAQDGSQGQVQKTLLQAAREAKVKRFAPSCWSFGLKGHETVTWLRLAIEGLWEQCEIAEREDGMQCTRFNCGLFMNYLGIGAHDREAEKKLSDEEKLEKMKQGGGYIPGDDMACEGVDRSGDMPDGSGTFLLSLGSASAEVPVTENGGYPNFSMTTIRDVGRFVAASLELERWVDDLSMVGDTVRMDKMIQLAEEFTGKKFTVSKITTSEVESEIKTLTLPKDFLKLLWLELKRDTARDEMGFAILDGKLNRLCPKVAPVSFHDYLKTQWAGK
jgi:hypothetical protein